jgi:hypothetical protein
MLKSHERSQESWQIIRRTLRTHYKRRTGIGMISADTMQELWTNFLLRTAGRPHCLKPDQYGRTIARIVGDTIVDQLKAAGADTEQRDAEQTYALLCRNSGGPVCTCSHIGRRKVRTDFEQRVLDTVRLQEVREQSGEIEIYRPAVRDVSFA